MIAKLIDALAQSRRPEVDGLFELLKLVANEERYRAFINRPDLHLQRFAERKPLLETGHFSGADLLTWITILSPNPGTVIHVVGKLLERLCEWGIAMDNGIMMPHAWVRYSWNTPLVISYLGLDVIDNALFGPSFIAAKYRASVPAVFVVKGEDQFIGTGFFVSLAEDVTENFIVTAKHNVDPSEGIKFQSFNQPEGVTYLAKAENWSLHDTLDIAAIPVAVIGKPTPIYTIGPARILSRTITMGYPRIGRTAAAYLLSHSGEVNAIVDDFNGATHLIISNLVAPGNSGGPVLDEMGICIGMVVQSFEAQHEGGIHAASAALPAAAIIEFLNTLKAEPEPSHRDQ